MRVILRWIPILRRVTYEIYHGLMTQAQAVHEGKDNKQFFGQEAVNQIRFYIFYNLIF